MINFYVNKPKKTHFIYLILSTWYVVHTSRYHVACQEKPIHSNGNTQDEDSLIQLLYQVPEKVLWQILNQPHKDGINLLPVTSPSHSEAVKVTFTKGSYLRIMWSSNVGYCYLTWS